MTDRYLPDKAIDALDEAGSRIHITNIIVPQQVLELESQLEIIRNHKTKAVNSQKYEEAAKLRDDEKNMEAALNSAQKQWEDDSKLNREVVTEDNVAEVVSMMTGIPVNRVAEAESHRLHDLPNLIKEVDLIYITFDVDSMDCDLISHGTGTPVTKGFDEVEIKKIITGFLETEKVACLEFVVIKIQVEPFGSTQFT